MNNFKHVGGLWLLAQIFHPFLFCLLVLSSGGSSDVLIHVFPLALVTGVLASSPLLVLALWMLPVIIHAQISVSLRILLWALFLLLGTLVSAAVAIGHFTQWKWDSEAFLYPLPALIALALAFVIRVAAFEKLCAAVEPSFDPAAWNLLLSQKCNTQIHES